jgi:hypothetical protein
MEIQKAFNTKTRVKFYVPMDMSLDKFNTYSIESMDLVSAFIEPIRDGIRKENILEFLTDPLYSKMDLFSFLRHRHFIALEEDFENLFMKYTKSEERD